MHTLKHPRRRPACLVAWLIMPLLVAALGTSGPVQAQGASPEAVGADLQMALGARPYREAAERFVLAAIAGRSDGALDQLSPALRARSGDAALRQALSAQILPFFRRGRGISRSVTVTRTTDAAGHGGYAFYMWLFGVDGDDKRPFTVYVVDEDGRQMIANVVPDRLIAGRHQP
jgi:hypothetical protein